MERDVADVDKTKSLTSLEKPNIHFPVSPFCGYLRWFGTDLEAGFVIYAENGPRAVFGVSLGVRKCEFYESPQIPGGQYTWRRPQPRMRRCTGRWAVVRWLVSEGHQPQSALGVKSAVVTFMASARAQQGV